MKHFTSKKQKTIKYKKMKQKNFFISNDATTCKRVEK